MYKYAHGGNAIFEQGKQDIMDLSANINPLGLPKNVAEAIIREIPNIVRYPDNFSTALCEKTAAFEDVDADWVIFGNGASDIIFRLPRAVGADKIMVCAPTFADYERSALSYGAKISRYALRKDNDFMLDDGFFDVLQDENPGLVYICNPNNPTGKLTDRRLIQKLLDYCKRLGTVVAVDECFMDFAPQATDFTSKFFLAEYPNLVILKAFTKMFALPGIRLGYALSSDKDLINRLFLHGTDWAVSNLAQAAGLASLDGVDEYIRQTVAYVTNERSVMEKELSSMGYTVFTSAANYIFFLSPFQINLQLELDKMGIRIRSCANYHGLDNTYYRVAISTSKNNTKFLAAVRKVSPVLVFMG